MAIVAMPPSEACLNKAGFQLDEPVSLRRLGLNYDPPSLILEYERVSSGRLFHRKIGLKRLGPESDPARVAEKIRRANESLLAEDKVPFDQLVSVIAQLQKTVTEAEQKKAEHASVPGRPDSPQEKAPLDRGSDQEEEDRSGSVSKSIDGEVNLNKLSTAELEKHKRQMDVEFFKNQKKPGDPGFKWDVRVDHEVADDASSCGWDEDND
mmetsp:Transcript_20994/g.45411  ORF Transcript_20994/g.45411 Transcript_20994/m.45411 type:complete len:209 (-) Transcript_20994:192-818(-)